VGKSRDDASAVIALLPKERGTWCRPAIIHQLQINGGANEALLKSFGLYAVHRRLFLILAASRSPGGRGTPPDVVTGPGFMTWIGPQQAQDPWRMERLVY